MGPAARRKRCVRPSLRCRISSACSSTRKCLEIAGTEIEKGRASSVPEASPCDRRSKMARRVGSASAKKTVVSCSAESLTIQLIIRRSRIGVKCPLPSAHLLHNLPGRSRSLSGSAFHKALELDRAMFAREVNGPLPHALVSSEAGILPYTPARVTAQKVSVAGRIAQRHLACIVGADARKDKLQLLQAVLGILLQIWEVRIRRIGRRWRICSSSVSACIVDQQPIWAGLTTGSVPERLNIQVRDDKAIVRVRPGAILVPIRPIEL